MEAPRHIKLSELTNELGKLIKSHFESRSYWVLAEVTNHKFYPNQDRHYLELVEKSERHSEPMAKIRGVAWQEGTQKITEFEKTTGQVFQNGLQVLLQVKVEYHSAFGLSLVIHNIDPYFTLGMLEMQKRETLKRLVQLNPGLIIQQGDEYLTRNKSIHFNPVIQKIAILASPNSEGYKDFIHTLQVNEENYKFDLDIYQTSVQGLEAGPEIVRKLVAIFESQKNYHAVVIIRGGGSKTDFLVFDSYEVARAVARFPIPIITGIGHLGDVSIADRMTNTSTKTPTKAAEFILAHNRFFESRLLDFQKSIIVKSQQLMAAKAAFLSAQRSAIIHATQRFANIHQTRMIDQTHSLMAGTRKLLYLEGSSISGSFNSVLSKINLKISRNQDALHKSRELLNVHARQYLNRKSAAISNTASLIRIMDPMNLLKKGFAIIHKQGIIQVNANAISENDHITIKMMDQTLEATVLNKQSNDGK